jgi:sugar lactone lactonase YvrE
MNRRTFLTVAAAAPAASALSLDLNKIPTRKLGKVEIVFKSPGDDPKPNGLQATSDGLWIIDQGAGNKAYLVNYKGDVLRSFETETDRSSGITFDGNTLWIGSTYNREIVRVDAHTGKALERHFTPGAGVIYNMVGDPKARSSPLARPNPPRPQSGAAKQVGGFQAKFPTAGNRPHGIGWEGKYLWVADSNLNAFFKHDPETGEMVEKIQLSDTDPLPHGMTIWEGNMWYCDDVGVVCRLRLS